MDWDFRIALFAGARHPGVLDGSMREGELVFIVSLKGESTAALEILVSQKRMRRGEISKAEFTDLRPGGKLTNLNVTAETRIPWAESGNQAMMERFR